ncbi:MAG: SpoIID/LytB domain-containing protein [Terracidiphilus sp.]|jgi:stage II sporulation protein D
MKLLAHFALVAAVGGSAIGASRAETAAHPLGTLRVGLWTLWHDKQISVFPEPGATLRLCASCAETPLKRPLLVRADGERVSAEGKGDAEFVFLDGAVTLAAHGEKLTLHNPLRITARKGELVLAVTLPVETYVERVVASESGAADSVESLKALAIVVRSFALHERHGHADYDLCDSTHCQLLHWAGGSGRQAAAHAATLATAGETLWFHGQKAQAWFHQNCGGRTASVSEVWPGKTPGTGTMPWLVSRADPWCTAGGAREWAADLSLTDLTAAMAAAGLARPGWKTLTVARRGESGRAVTLAVGANQISAEDFRLAVGRAMGWNKILSTWFEIVPQGDHFVFHGRGSGHGVGLCQAGAAAMGAAGRDAAQILAQYFPGATAADEATGKVWQVFGAKGFVLETLEAADGAFMPQLTRALGEAEGRSGIQMGQAVTVRAFRSTGAFRDATLAPGWVAAFTEGDWIAMQPLATLASRRLLVATARHEFLHALVEGKAAPSTQLWLREGLVEAWGDDAPMNGTKPAMKLDEIDGALSQAATEAQSQAAHRAAGWYAQRLLDRYGRGQVLQWLETGLPASAVGGLK